MLYSSGLWRLIQYLIHRFGCNSAFISRVQAPHASLMRATIRCVWTTDRTRGPCKSQWFRTLSCRCLESAADLDLESWRTCWLTDMEHYVISGSKDHSQKVTWVTSTALLVVVSKFESLHGSKPFGVWYGSCYGTYAGGIGNTSYLTRTLTLKEDALVPHALEYYCGCSSFGPSLSHQSELCETKRTQRCRLQDRGSY